MEKELYKALALVLLESRKDQYGNIIQSPLDSAMQKWASENREDIADVLIKKFKIEDFATLVSDKIVEELTKSNSWNKTYDIEKIHNMILDKVSAKLAEQQLEKLKQSN